MNERGSDKRSDWEKIKRHAPELAEFLMALAKAFGPAGYIKADLHATGETIEQGEYYEHRPPARRAGTATRPSRGRRFRRY